MKFFPNKPEGCTHDDIEFLPSGGECKLCGLPISEMENEDND